MSEIKKNTALEFIVNTLQDAIADSKIETLSPNECIVKDGNDEIQLVQEIDGDLVNILITDSRKIIYSEDLVETLEFIHMDVLEEDPMRKVLESTRIIINGLDINTDYIAQAIKELLDELSTSYEFVRPIKNNINQFQSRYKFDKFLFELIVKNEAKEITVASIFAAGFDPSIQVTIEKDVKKVEQALNKMFKAD